MADSTAPSDIAARLRTIREHGVVESPGAVARRREALAEIKRDLDSISAAVPWNQLIETATIVYEQEQTRSTSRVTQTFPIASHSAAIRRLCGTLLARAVIEAPATAGATVLKFSLQQVTDEPELAIVYQFGRAIVAALPEHRSLVAKEWSAQVADQLVEPLLEHDDDRYQHLGCRVLAIAAEVEPETVNTERVRSLVTAVLPEADSSILRMHPPDFLAWGLLGIAAVHVPALRPLRGRIRALLSTGITEPSDLTARREAVTGTLAFFLRVGFVSPFDSLGVLITNAASFSDESHSLAVTGGIGGLVSPRQSSDSSIGGGTGEIPTNAESLNGFIDAAEIDASSPVCTLLERLLDAADSRSTYHRVAWATRQLVEAGADLSHLAPRFLIEYEQTDQVDPEEAGRAAVVVSQSGPDTTQKLEERLYEQLDDADQSSEYTEALLEALSVLLEEQSLTDPDRFEVAVYSALENGLHPPAGLKYLTQLAAKGHIQQRDRFIRTVLSVDIQDYGSTSFAIEALNELCEAYPETTSPPPEVDHLLQIAGSPDTSDKTATAVKRLTVVARSDLEVDPSRILSAFETVLHGDDDEATRLVLRELDSAIPLVLLAEHEFDFRPVYGYTSADDWSVRANAIGLLNNAVRLGAIRPKSRYEAILARGMGDSKTPVRRAAIHGLMQYIATHDAVSIPLAEELIIAGLRDGDDSSTRRNAIEAYTNLTERYRPKADFIPGMIAQVALADHRHRVRVDAALALSQTARAHPSLHTGAVELLHSALFEEHERMESHDVFRERTNTTDVVHVDLKDPLASYLLSAIAAVVEYDPESIPGRVPEDILASRAEPLPPSSRVAVTAILSTQRPRPATRHSFSSE